MSKDKESVNCEYPCLKRTDEEGENIVIPLGVTCFGRGPFLKCKEKKISRNHGLLELSSDGQIFITAIHSTLFLKPHDCTEIKHLAKDERQLLRDGDEFRLLQDSYCYQLCSPKVSDVNNKQDQSVSGDTKPEAGAVGKTTQKLPGQVPGDGPEETSPAGQASTVASAGMTTEKGESSLVETTKMEEKSPEKHAATSTEALASSTPKAGSSHQQSAPDQSGRGKDVAVDVAKDVASSPSAGAVANWTTPTAKMNGNTARPSVVNGSNRKRKLPAFLLDLDSAVASSADTPKKRSNASTPGGARGRGRGAASGGRQPSEARGRGRGRGRPSQREQLSQHSDDDDDDDAAPPPGRPSSPPPPLPRTDPAAGSATPVPRAASPPAVNPAASASVSAGQPATTDSGAAAERSPDGAASSRPQRSPARATGGNHDLSDDSGSESGAAAAPTKRESCAYGANCFRTNPVHRRDFSHPGDSDYVAPPPPPAAGEPLPECEFGINCYRRNPAHRQQFAHTSRPNPRREAKRKARQKARANATGDSDDSFINDSDSDDYAPAGDSGSDWTASEGEEESPLVAPRRRH